MGCSSQFMVFIQCLSIGLSFKSLTRREFSDKKSPKWRDIPWFYIFSATCCYLVKNLPKQPEVELVTYYSQVLTPSTSYRWSTIRSQFNLPHNTDQDGFARHLPYKAITSRLIACRQRRVAWVLTLDNPSASARRSVDTTERKSRSLFSCP